MWEATYFHTLLISSCYTSGSCILSPSISLSSSFLPPPRSLWSCSPPLSSGAVLIKGPVGWWHAACLTGRLHGCSGGPQPGLEDCFSPQTNIIDKSSLLAKHCVLLSSDWKEWIHFGLLSLLLLRMTHIQVRERRSRDWMGASGAEVRGRDGIQQIWGAGWEGRRCGSPDLCACRYQRPLHLAVSKPLQKNNKLWALFDRHLLQMETGQQMHAWWNRGEAVEIRAGSGGYKTHRPNRSWHLGKRPLQYKLLLLLCWEMGVKPKTGNSTLTQ